MHASPEQVVQDRKVKQNLENIKYPILVMSGKGGVGKSTVSTNLAVELARRGHSVGIMDIDIHGPNIPKMLGIEHESMGGTEERIEPVCTTHGLKVASLGLLGYDPDQAIVWRGPIKIGLIKQFLGDINWGSLDYLIIDTPPGTGDENLTIAQAVHNLAGAVVVTTPQDVSILDSRKSLTFAQKLRVPILGLVENMAGFACPCCGTVTHIFKEGGGERAASDLGVPFLGSIPLDPSVVLAGDSGKPLETHQDYPGGRALLQVVDKVLEAIKGYEDHGVYAAQKAPEGFKPER